MQIPQATRYSHFLGKRFSDGIHKPRFRRPEPPKVIPGHLEAEFSIGASADLMRIFVILSVILPVTYRTEIKPAGCRG